MVNIFSLRCMEPSGIGLCARLDFIERGHDLMAFFGSQNSCRCDGSRPGTVEGEFLREQAAIELPGTLELIKRGIGRALEPAAPHFLVFRRAHRAAASSGTVMGS